MAFRINNLSEADIQHRESFKSFVLRHAEPWHQEHLGRLYDVWEKANARFFMDEMVTPYIMLNVPNATRSFGDCSAISAFGGRSQIRIRPSILRGDHPVMRQGNLFAEGRFRFAADIMLHEMIHQWQQEVTGKVEPSYKGHGPAFRDKCNEIGALIGLEPVRVAKARGKLRSLPSCAHWPHCVRPEEFYLGATSGLRSVLNGKNEVLQGQEFEVHAKRASGKALEMLLGAAKNYWDASLHGTGLESACEELCEAACFYGEVDGETETCRLIRKGSASCND